VESGGWGGGEDVLTFFWLLFLGGEVPRLVAVEGEVGEDGRCAIHFFGLSSFMLIC